MAINPSVLTPDALLSQLEGLGKEQTRKTYSRHGITAPFFGVSYADLGALKKRIKKDHTAAGVLWVSGNHDARVLATMIADPQAATMEELDAWAHDLNNYIISDNYSRYVATTPHALALAKKWIDADHEWIEATGWNILASLAGMPNDIDNDMFATLIPRIEREVGTAKNRVRHSMNMTLINIGARNAGLREKINTVAPRIGKIKVDHGETGCKTPDIVPYVDKMWARKQ